MEREQKMKIVVVGPMGVGKSALINKFCDGVFLDTYDSTVGVDFRIRNISHEHNQLRLQLWDTAG
jgi:Ras-related protein Rab-1A